MYEFPTVQALAGIGIDGLESWGFRVGGRDACAEPSLCARTPPPPQMVCARV